MTSSKIHIALVGGGTGGHFYPLMSLAETLNASDERPTLHYLGPEPYDANALADRGIHFVRIPAGKQRRYFSILNYLDFFVTLYGVIVALCKLFFIYPDVIVSKGGYTSVPVVLAGMLLNIPIIVHESDALPGRANKLGARFAREVLVAYEEAARYFPAHKTHLVGIPIRHELLLPPSSSMLERFGIDPSTPVILALGGSQGAERLNEFILDALDELLPRFSIIHQTGKKNFNIVSATARQLIPQDDLFKRYHAVPFLEPNALNDAYHAATIIISRAGSGAIHEIAVHGKPSLIIPIPETISHDQHTNAFTYAKTGAALVMEEVNLSDNLLMAELERIIGNPQIYNEMAAGAQSFGIRDAAEKMADITLAICRLH